MCAHSLLPKCAALKMRQLFLLLGVQFLVCYIDSERHECRFLDDHALYYDSVDSTGITISFTLIGLS